MLRGTIRVSDTSRVHVDISMESARVEARRSNATVHVYERDAASAVVSWVSEI